MAEPNPANGKSLPVPWLLLAGIAAATILAAVAIAPISDIDLYWHLIVGDEIRAGVPITGAGRGWTFSPVSDTWVSSQWLAEVLLSAIYGIGGFAALIAYRVVTAAVGLVVLAAVTLRGRAPAVGIPPFVIAAISLASATQERSQQLTFILAPLVGWWGMQLLREGKLPRWWVVLPLITVWSNFHGGWVLVPCVLLIAGAARLLSDSWRDLPARRAALLALGCLPAAMIAPLGWRNAFSSLTFSQATSQIAEWLQVRIVSMQGWQTAMFLVLFICCWAFGRTRASRKEVAYVLALVGLQLTAYRNITPVALILAPLAASTLSASLPPSLTEPVAPRMRRAAIALGGVGLVLGLAIALWPNRPLHDQPIALIERIRDHPTPVRVLNTYNLAGPTLWFGDGPRQVQVGIDGRTDKYGGPFIDRYLDYVRNTAAGWQPWLRSMNPDAALLATNDSLGDALQAQLKWRVVAREDNSILLVPPDATGW